MLKKPILHIHKSGPLWRFHVTWEDETLIGLACDAFLIGALIYLLVTS